MADLICARTARGFVVVFVDGDYRPSIAWPHADPGYRPIHLARGFAEQIATDRGFALPDALVERLCDGRCFVETLTRAAAPASQEAADAAR